MKLKFTLRSSGDVDTDLVATVDGTTTVGQLAEYLVLADPARGVAAASNPGWATSRCPTWPRATAPSTRAPPSPRAGCAPAPTSR